MLKRFLFIFTLVLLVAGISPAYAASFDNWRIGSPLPTGNNLYSSTYGPGKHVAVGDRGTILTSNDGTSWTSPDSGTTQALYGVTYSPGLYVAVGTGGTVLTSTDAESWTNHKVAGNVGFQAVTYGNGVYVAVGGSGAIQTSSNGTSWISRTSNVTGVLRGVAYGAGKFVAVGANGTILTSTDGTSWTKRDSGTTTQLFYGVTYGNGMYIAVGHGGMIVTSTNGETWTSGSTPGITVTFNSVTYGIDTYVAVGRGGTVVTSTNGVNWTKQTSGTEGFNMVSYGNGVYLAVGDLGNVATSNDSSAAIWVNHSSGTSSALYGITYGNDKYVAVGMTGTIMNLVEGNSTWQRVSSNTNQTLYGVTYANGRYVAVGNGGTVVTSSDGVNWTSKTWGSANSFRGVAYGNSTYVAVGTTDKVITSTDGTSWQMNSSYTTGYRGVVYGKNMFVAVGVNGTISTSSDGVSWTSRASGIMANLFSVSYGNGIFVATGTGGAIVTSSDGITWTSPTSNSTALLSGSTYGDDYHLAVGSDGSTVSSMDGVNWTNGTTVPSIALNAVAYGNGMFVTAGNAGIILQHGIPLQNSTINPTTASFDKYASATDYADVVVSMTLKGNSLASIKNGAVTLVSGTDYTVSGSSVTIKKEYLAAQAAGLVNLTFKFSAGADQTLAVTVSDTTPQNSTINPTTANFDKYASATDYVDITVSMTLNGNSLDGIKNDVATLVAGTDYTVSGSSVTIKKEYLATQAVGLVNLTFKFSAGADQTLAVTVSDSTPENSTINPTTANFDKYAAAADYADIAVSMTLNGNSLASIKNGSTTLISGTDYTESGSNVTIKKEYLATQSVGLVNLTFKFSAGADQTLAVTVSDTTPQNSTINPTTANFDKYAAATDYADIAVSMTLNGNSLDSIKSGAATLISGTDYTESGSGVTIKKEYLATQAVGLVNLTFKFSAGADQTLAVTVSDTTPQNSTINPTTASFDKYASATDYADVAVSMSLNGNSLDSIKNGAAALVSGTDYTESGSSVTIKKEYLATQGVGLVNLTFKFSAGADQTLAITVSDSTPQNSTINPTTANFDKYAAATDYADVAVSMTLNGNSLASIKNGAATLVPGTDYTESGSSVTIKKEFLANQDVGLVNLTFKFSAGADQTLAVTVSDTTPQNSTINPTTANFDKYTAATDNADVAVSMTLKGNSLASIKNGSTTLISGTDYTESGSSVTIKKEYLATQAVGLVNLTFKFSAGADQTLAVTVSDTTPQNSTINPTTANFDKYAAATDNADVAVSMTLKGNSLASIKNGSTTLISGTDYTESGSSVTIKKEYLATQAVGLVNLTFKFSAGADQTLAVTVSDSTPQNGTINPTTANFDKYATATDYTDVAVSMTLNGNSLASIKNGFTTLVSGTDYTETGSSVTIKKEYLAAQAVGLVNLTFKFNAGADQTLAVTVSDSTPQNSTINPTTANFDKYAAAADYADIAVSMTLNGNSLASIKNGSATLVSGTDYTETGSSVTIKKEYLATQTAGLVNLTFKFSAGADQTLAVTVSDSTPQNSTISPTTANFDKYTAATDYADVAVSMSLNGNSLDSIKNGAATLVSGTDYTESGSSVTIKKEYLATQAVGLVNLTFKFSAGADQTLAVTVSDSTPQNSTINPTTANFDKYAAGTEYANVAVSMTLNGNSLASIKNGAATLVPGTDYTESGSSVTIKKEYLATQGVGLVNLTFKFSAGADQTLAVTVSDSTPQNSTINPTTANFDKYAAGTEYADVAVSMTLNGNSLASIKNGAATLVSSTDYTESGSSVTIKKEYLATQSVGLVNLTFKFSAGADQTLAITVSDSTPQNSTISPTTANFDKYASATDYADVAVSMSLNGNSLDSIKNGSTTLISGTDYTESGSNVTIKKEYLATQAVGLVNLTFKFSAGADQTLAVTLSNSTPQASVPAAPADLRAITGDSQVHLSWTSVVQATYYNIYMSNESGSYGGTPTAAVFGTTSTQTGLINGTTYYFVVKAGNSVGESVYSQEVSAMPTAETLPSLTTVTMVSTNPNAAFAKTGDTVTLTFTADTAMGDIPTATIAGRAVNVSAAGNHTYVAAYTFDGSENEGIIPFTIDFTSVTGIQGAQVTGTTDNRTVLFDKTEPTGSLSVNGGAASTHTASVNLTIMSDDGSGAGSIQMRFSHDNATWSAWEAATLTKAWTLVPGDGSKTVYMQLMDAAGNMTTSIISASIQLQHSYESTSPGGSPSSPTETIPVNVNNGKNGDSWLVSTTIIQRTTDADGRKKDELTFTAQEAAKAVEKLAATGSSLAKIVIPDSNDEVQELKANLPMVAAELLAKANVSLELATHNSRIIIPPASLRGLEHDMYFRIVPIKKESERNEVEQRVKVERLVREVAGSNNVEIIGRPMIIETNMQSREVELVLPLGTATLKETQLKNLGIFVEHSDGTKEWLQGQIVSYDDNEKLGIRFKVNKFSTFTIVHIEGLPKPIHNAYINGYADGTFGANNPITRAEMATILSRVLTNEEKHTALSFTDVTLTHWAKESIDQAAQMGVMNGYPDGSFKPEASITRGEMAAIVVRLVDSVEKSDSGSFRDIDGHWAQAAIEKAKAAGIINGYEDETFRPEQTLTRAEAVTMMNKILGRGPLLGAASNWKDVPEKHWAHAQIQEASLDHQYEKTPNGEKYVPVN